MRGLIIELQAVALDRAVRVSDLLRKALVVSKKLQVDEVESWINNELNGYAAGSDIPEYRSIRGQVKVWNPYHGWQPLNFGDAKMGEDLSRRKISQPIGELDALNEGDAKGSLHIPFPQHIKNSGLLPVPRTPT